MQKVLILIIVATLMNGCMVKKIMNGGHGGKGAHEHSRIK